MNRIENVKELNFQEHGDARGQMIVIENGKDIPFDIKRIFYVYDADKDVIRGQHANKNSEFVFINVSGKCKIRVKDGTGNEKVFSLEKPNHGLYLPTMIWKDMYGFSSDAVLLVLTNTYYDANEYIRDYNEYQNECNK